MEIRSLRGKLGLFYAAALLVSLVLFAAGTIVTEHELRRASFDDRVETATRALIASTGARDGRLVLVGTDTSRFARIIGSRLNGAIIASDGTLLISSVLALPPGVSRLATAPPPATTLRTIQLEGKPYRVGITPVPRLSRPLGVAVIWQNFDAIAAIDRRLEFVFALMIPLVVALALVAGNLVTSRGLLPLRKLATVASTIAARDLSERLEIPPTNDELGLLCTTFNQMLARLQDALERERRFTSDASHELRAPLSVILAETDLTLRRPRSPAEYQRALRAISVQVGRLEALTRDLLAEARSESIARIVDLVPIDLGQTVRSVASDLAPLARQRSVSIDVVQDDAIRVRSSPESLRRALLCVAHNALKFSHGSVQIRVALDAVTQAGIITVADDGPGFSAAALGHATERFWRDSKERSGQEVADFAASGTGLGLAIASSFVTAAQGRLTIANRAPHGALVTIVLPAQTKTAGTSEDAPAATQPTS